jgi:hypothetical protein
MDMKKIVLMSLFLVTMQLAYGTTVDASRFMPYYHNTITGIDAIEGATSYTLIISCDQLDPIIVYAPMTYQESLDDTKITYFMPNTVLAPGIDEIPGVIESTSSGISIFLDGKLKQKLVADHKIFITIQVK